METLCYAFSIKFRKIGDQHIWWWIHSNQTRSFATFGAGNWAAWNLKCGKIIIHDPNPIDRRKYKRRPAIFIKGANSSEQKRKISNSTLIIFVFINLTSLTIVPWEITSSTDEWFITGLQDNYFSAVCWSSQRGWFMSISAHAVKL